MLQHLAVFSAFVHLKGDCIMAKSSCFFLLFFFNPPTCQVMVENSDFTPSQVGCLFTFLARQLAKPNNTLFVNRTLFDQVNISLRVKWRLLECSATSKLLAVL